MEDKDFAMRLAKLREQKGVSARDMSLSIGQNPGYINSIETGKIKPSMDTFFFICEYLGVTPSEFFDTEISNPTKLNSLIKNMKKLDNQKIEVLYMLVEEMIK